MKPETLLHGTIEAYARVVGSKGDVFVRVEGKVRGATNRREGSPSFEKGEGFVYWAVHCTSWTLT